MSTNTLQIRFLEAVRSLNLKHEIAEIASKTGFGQSTVSTYLSSKREVSLKFLKRFAAAYELDYEEIRNGKKKGQALSGDPMADRDTLLSQLLQKQNQLMEMQNKLLERQAVNIEEKVQATDARTSRMETNLTRVLTGVETLSIRQEAAIKDIAQNLSQLKAEKKDASPGGYKKSDQIDGGGGKQGKKH